MKKEFLTFEIKKSSEIKKILKAPPFKVYPCIEAQSFIIGNWMMLSITNKYFSEQNMSIS